MKFTVIHGSKAEAEQWEESRLERAASALGWEFSAVALTRIGEVEDLLPQLGEVVYYRGSDLHGVDRVNAKERIGRGRVLVNRILMQYPYLVCKSHQQLMVHGCGGVASIPTWRFKNVEEVRLAVAAGGLTLPFIQKPEIGSRGVGVRLVREMKEVDEERISRSVFQPYVPNDGDLRVLVADGSVVGVVKRMAAPGRVVNNLSQGAAGVMVRDPALLARIEVAVVSILQVLPYDVAGIDLIEEQGSSRLIFLEINSVPRWEHFERITSIDVAQSIMRLAQKLAWRQAVSLTV